MAIERHPTLRADMATVRSAEQNVLAGRSEFFPVLGLVGEVNMDHYVRTAGPLDLQGREIGVRADQLIYDGLGVFARLEGLEAEREALEADRDRNGNTVAFGVARAYLLVLRDRAIVESARRNVDEHRRSAARLVAIVKHDRGKAFDLEQVRTREVFAESLLAEREALLLRDEAVYRELVGQAAGTLQPPAAMAGEGFESLEQALAIAQAQHPMVVAAERRAQGARAALDQQRALLSPRLFATARYDTGFDRQGVRGWNSAGYVGASARFTYGAQSVSSIRVAEARLAAAEAQVEAARRDVREAVRVAWVQREGIIADLPPAEEGLRQSMLVLEGFKTQYTFGRRTALDLLIVQNEAFRAEAKAVGLRFDRLIADLALAAQIGVLEGHLLADLPAPATQTSAR